MSKILETAGLFFDACETGKGWERCSAYCHANATFAAQSGVLAEIQTIEAYTEWAKGILGPLPDGHYELRFIGEDEGRACVSVCAVFHGTHTGEGGPVAPTGKTLAADYVYALQFEDGRIRHMSKIWNDTYSLQQLGWA